MPEQARKTLLSLSTAYQRGIAEEDYEVIVVENASDKNMDPQVIAELPKNFRYFLRNETLPTPVPAIHEGVNHARGKIIGLMIDGARMASPGLVRHILLASRLSRNTVISVPGYHLGNTVQQEAIRSGYNEDTERALLESIAWPKDGYRLFEISCMSATSKSGFFRPMGESNCFCVPRHIWNRVGGVDKRFTCSGGGQANLDFYKRVCELDDIDLVLLAGEGTFHQYHGGITTGTMGAEREKIMQEHFEQYRSLRGEYYRAPTRRPMLFGNISDHVLSFMDHSVKAAMPNHHKEKEKA